MKQAPAFPKMRFSPAFFPLATNVANID